MPDADVNMNEIAEEYRLSHWAEIVREREGSGMTIKEYCKNAGIHENKYYYWQKKLRKAMCRELANIQSNPANMTPTVFAEVKLPTQQTLKPAAAMHHNQVCIEAAGVRVTAGSEYPVDMLGELLRMVARPCC